MIVFIDAMKYVVVFGVFDRLHPGHLYFLREAKKYGDHLAVVVTRDGRALAEKKRKPFFNERERLEMVRAIKRVDRAVLGDRVGEWRVLKRLRPDVVCVGYDQAQFLPLIIRGSQRGLRKITPKIIRIKSYKTNRYRSSKMRK